MTLVAAGLMLSEALTAAELLGKSGVSCDVIDLHTINPITHPEVVLDSVKKTGVVVTVEDHNIIGGVGTVVADIVAGHGTYLFHRIGLHNTFGETGTPAELTERYGLDAGSISSAVQDLLKRH